MMDMLHTGTKYALRCLVAVFALFVVTTSAHAAQTVPYKLNFQGRLADSAGNLMADGLYNMRFRILDAPTGGNTLWTETRETTNRVTVSKGIFSVQLGDVSALTPTTLYPLYVEIELPTPATATCSTGGCASWTEGAMTPRPQLTSNAYAMNADTIDGIDGASLAQLSANQTLTGNNTVTGTFTYQPASDSTTAFQLKNNAGAALLVADTTNLMLKVGGGDVSPDADPALLVLDYKNTSGDPSGIDGAMYYNSSAAKFRCLESGIWKDCISSTRTRYEVHDDLMFGNQFSLSDSALAADGAFALRIGSNGGSFARQAGELNHPGILRLQAGNFFVSANLAALTSSLNTTHQVLFGSGIWASNTMLRIPASNLSDGTNTYTTYNGFLDGTTQSNISPSNGCFLRYTHGTNSGKWQGVCRNGGSETGCDTGVTVAVTNWYNLATTVNAAGTLATFAVYDTNAGTTSTCTVSTNIPTSNPVSFTIGLTRSAGSANRAIDYDYVEYVSEGLSR